MPHANKQAGGCAVGGLTQQRRASPGETPRGGGGQGGCVVVGGQGGFAGGWPVGWLDGLAAKATMQDRPWPGWAWHGLAWHGLRLCGIASHRGCTAAEASGGGVGRRGQATRLRLASVCLSSTLQQATAATAWRKGGDEIDFESPLPSSSRSFVTRWQCVSVPLQVPPCMIRPPRYEAPYTARI